MVTSFGKLSSDESENLSKCLTQKMKLKTTKFSNVVSTWNCHHTLLKWLFSKATFFNIPFLHTIIVIPTISKKAITSTSFCTRKSENRVSISSSCRKLLWEKKSLYFSAHLSIHSLSLTWSLMLVVSIFYYCFRSWLVVHRICTGRRWW